MIRDNIEVKMCDGSLRRVRTLLPEDYESSKERYPVLYLFDGQNIFDEEDSFAGVTWDVQEAMEVLVKEKRIRPFIIVAIDIPGKKDWMNTDLGLFQMTRTVQREKGKNLQSVL